jgi:pimeloyl-ACP methyl ester carboxylesterase
MAPIISALAERYTAIAADMRGMADSSRPVSGYAASAPVANDIHQLVRRLGCEKMFLVGHDRGGAVAYAYTHPSEVPKLAIST